VVSPLVPPSVSPRQCTAFFGLFVVAPVQVVDVIPCELDTFTEVAANLVSKAPQVWSSAAHKPVVLGPGAAACTGDPRIVAKPIAKPPLRIRFPNLVIVSSLVFSLNFLLRR
jgi:hypothetical protein